MANNRMFLVNTRTGAKIQIAKYYPSTGWYCSAGLENALNEAFHEADFGHLTHEERQQHREKVGFGPPYSAGGMHGAEWVLELEDSGDKESS